MSAAVLWLLIVAGGGQSSFTVIAKFETQAECMVTAKQIHDLARSNNGPYANAMCVSARGVK